METKAIKEVGNNNPLRIMLDAFFQEIKRLIVLAFDDTTSCSEKFLIEPTIRNFRVNAVSYNVLIDGRTFYDQPIGNQFKKCDEIRKIATWQGDDYTTGCLLDYQ